MNDVRHEKSPTLPRDYFAESPESRMTPEERAEAQRESLRNLVAYDRRVDARMTLFEKIVWTAFTKARSADRFIGSYFKRTRFGK